MKVGKLKRRLKGFTKKASYLVLAMVTFFTQFNLPLFISALSSDVHYDISSVADPDTQHIENDYTGDPQDDGKIWTDKTVTHIDEDLFDITLSAVGQSFETKSVVSNAKKVDVVFILDVSGSMEDNGRYISMTSAVNQAIGTIMKANSENRIGIVTFSDNSSTLLPLDSYHTTDNSTRYLEYGLDGFLWPTPYISATSVIRDSNNQRENGSVDVSGGTYTQKGMDTAKDMLEATSDTEDRVPVVILLSDGIPTYGTSKYDNVGNSEYNLGNGYTDSYTGDTGYYTILTGMDSKEKIEAHYNTESKYYTIGMDVTDIFGKVVLNPTRENINQLGNNGKEGDLKDNLMFSPYDYNYVDRGYADNISGDKLNSILEEITSDIISGTSSPLEGSGNVDSRTMLFTDTLGEGVEVKDEPKVLFDGQEYIPTSTNKTANYTEYVYNYAVTNSSNEAANLSDLRVRVHNYNGKQTIQFQIPKTLFPFLNRYKNNPETSVNPIRLITRVGLSDEAVKAARTGDVFYTNDLTDEARVTFSPVRDNPYYYENIVYNEDGTVASSTPKYDNKSLEKSENLTGTSNTYYSTNFNHETGVVTTKLGNNGKMVLIDPQETTEKTVYKDWQDGDNQDGLRTPVEVELYANGTATGKKATLTEENGWQYTFENLQKYTNNQEISYTVRELTQIDGYETTYSEDQLTIINTHEVETINKTVEKIWHDNNDQDGIRPTSVSVQLYANETPEGTPVTLSKSNNWRYTFENLDKNANGKPIDYTVEEVSNIEGYTSEVTTTSSGNFQIINTHTTEKIAKTAVKEWDDNNNQDGIRPTSIEVELYANGKATGKKETLNAENNWRHTFSDLERNENGEAIEYSIVETTSVPGYTSSYGEDGTDLMTIVNAHTPETTEINVEKKWDDKNNQDGVRPDQITITLYANGESKSTRVITAEDNWKTSFTNLPKYDSGKEIEYTVTENPIEGYTLSSNVTSDNTITLTNSYTPELTSKTVVKEWRDSNNQDGIRPEYIEVQLYANGTKTGSPVQLSESNQWTYTFENLDKNQAGEEIKYTVEEVNVPNGYTVRYENDTFKIINTHYADTMDIPVQKVWLDENNLEGFRPDSITVELHEKGSQEAVNTITLDARNNWKGTFHDVAVNKNGQKVEYEVKEVNVLDTYNVSYSKDGDTFIITNERNIERVENTVTKVWDDNGNQDGIRPNNIRVQLYQNGVAYGSEITLSDSNAWTYHFTHLPKYKDGELARYTVEEVSEVAGYHTIYSADTFTITNTHTPETTTIQVEKIWDDHNNQDGIRPNEVVILLLANGEVVGEIPLTKDNWSGSFENVPVYQNGEKITYTVREKDVPTGYSVIYGENQDGTFTVTNVHTPEQTSVTAEKVWNDMNNKDNLRSDYIAVNLLANGEVIRTIYLSNDNNWKEQISGLDKYFNGELINYTLSEISKIAGYETTYSSDTFTIVNNHEIISVTKTVDKKQVRPGEILTYTITVSNDGDVDADNIVVVDKLNENLEFISSAEGVYDPSTHTVTYDINSILAGDKKTFILTVKVSENVTEDISIGNIALVLGDEGEEVPSNEVITKVEVPPTDEVFENPETSDDISIILLTGILNTMMLGYLIIRKRFRNA